MSTIALTVGKEQLLRQLRELGVEFGMNLMVHSSLRTIGPVEGGAEGMIDTLLEAIGPDGTLMMPSITGNVTATQPVFHAEHSPSTVGYLTETFRRRPGAVRSLHPVHSVAALGPQAEHFTRDHLAANTPWSPATPFGRMLCDANCNILFLGVNLTYNSCFHALEIEARLPGMHTAEGSILYVVTGDGTTHEVVHHWHDPRTKRYFADMEGILHDSGCLQWGRTGLGISRLVQAAPMREVILGILAEEPWLMTRPPADNTFIWEP